MTGSWDCTVRCWDPRTGGEVAKLPQPYKVFSMTQGGGRLVVATAYRAVNIYDKRKMVRGPCYRFFFGFFVIFISDIDSN